jgi:hypothetical protein
MGWAWGIARPVSAQAPIQIGFLWHMHQPIYYPYETPIEVDAAGRFSFSVVDVHNGRFGPYTTWPRDAVQAGLGLSHLGAQISFSGSLIENLNSLAAAGVNGGMWTSWDWGYDQGVSWTTALGNPRLDMVAFGYHHPLMPLLDGLDTRMQIKLHKLAYAQTWTGGPSYTRGMFPAETAFSTRMIPALVAEGIDWVLVDNIHFDRACKNYPHTTASNLYAPNPADQINPDPAASGGAWVSLNNLWAPGQVSAPFGYQPHYAQHVDPVTGAISRIIVVPAARYEGNEDGRGGYGAFLYDLVMDQYLGLNTDPNHPMFVVLHHDGDNFGGGSEAYYHHNFQNMVNWVSTDPDYDVTTVQDYLDRFPPATNDVIHVENGSWAGADNGDPEFKKWLGDPDAGGWSPDRNSWAVLTAAKNRVFAAEQVAAAQNMNNILNGIGSATEQAWHWLLVSQASDYWYWDGTEIWDSNVTRACNQAVVFADQVIAGQPDATAPTIFLPQREPYNPGGFEWAPVPEPSDFEVWTYVDDASGLASVTLRWRVDLDGENPLASVQNETYAGGAEVGAWNDVAMSDTDIGPQNGVLAATYRARRYGAMIIGQEDVLIDYYVTATDTQGNVANSDIQHVWVGAASGGPGGDAVVITPDPAQAGQDVTIDYDPAGRVLASAAQVLLHYGFNDWQQVPSPDPAMTWDAIDEVWRITVPVSGSATQLDLVFNDGTGTWDNNNGQDWHFNVQGGEEPPPTFDWQMDGVLDSAAQLVAQHHGVFLYAAVAGDALYVAATDAGEGNDHFILLADVPGALQSAMWAKSGQIAGWAAFLADENDNDYSGWFDAGGTAESATGPNGGVIEGTIDLAAEFGNIPTAIHLAFAAYGTGDGSGLIASAQVPASVNADGNVDAGEYLLVDLCSIRVDRPRADLNTDCVVSVADHLLLADCLNGPTDGPAAGCLPGVDADLDADGDVDLVDFGRLQRAIGE